MHGGETEIRTLEGVATLPVFKTGAFNRSAISPCVIEGFLYTSKKKVKIYKYLFNISKLRYF